jgi:hypothetical protein
MAKRVYNIGDHYDKLTVEGFTDEARVKAICRCDCGRVVQIRPSLLGYNRTNNCGCAPRGKWQGVGQVSKTYFHRTARNARVRGLDFQVSLSYLANLYEKQEGKCALTGLPIPFGKRTAHQSEASLDRVDSTKGYVEGNVQWVHKDVNKMKMDFTTERFLELCALVTALTR